MIFSQWFQQYFIIAVYLMSKVLTMSKLTLKTIYFDYEASPSLFFMRSQRILQQAHSSKIKDINQLIINTTNMNQEQAQRQTLLTEAATENEELAPAPEPHPVQEQMVEARPRVRIQSLDVYRGLTMVGMILVDNMGPVRHPPWFLDHAEWDGLTPADLIFPAFLFIMGIAIPLAVSEKRPVRIRNLLRIAALFLIGFFLNLLGKKFDFEKVRILGILQRLSLCYAAMILVHVLTNYAKNFRIIVASFFMFCLYCAYLIVMISFEGADILDPSCGKANNLTDRCNFAGYIDHLILTDNHCFKGGYTDPEGIFSTTGAIITTFMGYLFSLIMSQHKSQPKKLIMYWLGISLTFGAIVYPMTLMMSLNKKIYSGSFTLIVVAISGASLTFFYCLVDLLPAYVPGAKRVVEIVTAPLKWLGLNPLAIFVLMDMVAIFMIIYIKIDDKSVWTRFYETCFKSWISDEAVGATVFACFFWLLWTIVAGVMHKYKLYLRL